MTDTIRWGVISTANIGRKRVIPAIQASRNGEVVAVASRDPDRARAFAAELGIPAAYGSYEDLLADPNVDAIYNPLPNSEHAQWSIACAEAGKPTLCEKPLARDAAEAQMMVDAFAVRRVLFAEAFMYRFHPQTVRVREMVGEGAIGGLQVINAAFTFALHSDENIRLRKDLAGGSLMDVGCYCVNVMRLMTGEEPVEARALAEIGPRTGVDELLAGLLRFPSGVLGHFDSGLRAYRQHSYELRGGEGRIVVPEAFTPDASADTTIHYWRGDDYRAITIPAVDQYRLMVEDFAEALIMGRPPCYAPQDGVANMAVIDALLAGVKG